MLRVRCAGPCLAARSIVVALALWLMVLSTAWAQTASSAPSTIPAHPANMSDTQLQGVSCIITGLTTALGAIIYSAPLAVAVEWSLPLVFAPMVAGSYAVGCSVGATTGPGAHWLWAWYNSRPSRVVAAATQPGS